MTNYTLTGAKVDSIDQLQRIVTVVIVPYGEPALVDVEGKIWEESFAPGAFDGLRGDPQDIRVNREHNSADVVGRVVAFDPRDPRGLVADLQIARTARGDDTLQLAQEGMLSVSIGAASYPEWIDSDRVNRVRRIRRAMVDHVSLVMRPAYSGAKVLSVRSRSVSTFGPDHPIHLWAQMRLDPVHRWARKRLEGKRP
jgi:HK97 family phage prohead protease